MAKDVVDGGLVRLVPKKKPLTVSDRRALEKLMDADFSALTAELRVMATDEVERRQQAVKERHAAELRRLEEAERTAAEMVKSFKEDYTEFVRGLREDGIAVRDKYGDRSVSVSVDVPHRFSLTSIEDEMNEVDAEVNRELSRALSVARRQAAEAKRSIILSAISEEAATVIQAIPSARDLFVAAQSDGGAVRELSR